MDDDLFDQYFTEEKKEPTVNKDNEYNKYKNFKKSKYPNVIGKNEINLWNKDKVDPLELDINDMRTDEKFAVIALPNKTYKLENSDYKIFNNIINLLKKKGYKVRIVCSFTRAIHKSLMDTFGEELLHITPWKGFCKEQKDIKQYLVTDSNIRAAANYIKNFNKLPSGVQLIKSAIISTITGLDNNELVDMVIVHDRNYNGKNIDYKISQDIVDYVFLAKPFSYSFYNIAKDDDYSNLKQILE